jgi:hypothetical protein
MKYRDHVLYKDRDFTREEIARENPLAMAVIRDQLRICKYCGRTGRIELREPCKSRASEAHINGT